MGMDLRAPKQRFASLMEDIGPTITSQFVVWLDEKVAEFKVNGSMNFDINIDAPRWIRDYSMSVMLSSATQQNYDKESDSKYKRASERQTPIARRKDPVSQPRQRPRIPSPPPISPVQVAEPSLVTKHSEKQVDRGHKRLHQDIDTFNSSIVHQDPEFTIVKRELHDGYDGGSDINGAGDSASSAIVKSEPLSPSHQSYELDDRPHLSDTLPDNTDLDQSESQSESVQTIFTPGANQLVATAASTSSSLQGASGDDSFQDAIFLGDSDDSREGNPDNFMRKIITYESHDYQDNDSMLQESVGEGVAGPSGQGSDNAGLIRATPSSRFPQRRSHQLDSITHTNSEFNQVLSLSPSAFQAEVFQNKSNSNDNNVLDQSLDMSIPAEGGFQCMFCSNVVMSVTELRKHMYNDHLQREAMSYKCVRCSAVICDMYKFVRHCISHYRLYQCSRCDRRFSRLEYLRRHVACCSQPQL